MTRTPPPQPSTDREATVMSYSGGSPPSLPLHVVTCPRNHPISDPADYFLSPSGKAKTCRICRLAWTEQWLNRQSDPAVQAERAARKEQQASDRLVRLAERRAGIDLLQRARRTTRARRKGRSS